MKIVDRQRILVAYLVNKEETEHFSVNFCREYREESKENVLGLVENEPRKKDTIQRLRDDKGTGGL